MVDMCRSLYDMQTLILARRRDTKRSRLSTCLQSKVKMRKSNRSEKKKKKKREDHEHAHTYAVHAMPCHERKCTGGGPCRACVRFRSLSFLLHKGNNFFCAPSVGPLRGAAVTVDSSARPPPSLPPSLLSSSSTSSFSSSASSSSPVSPPLFLFFLLDSPRYKKVRGIPLLSFSCLSSFLYLGPRPFLRHHVNTRQYS